MATQKTIPASGGLEAAPKKIAAENTAEDPAQSELRRQLSALDLEIAQVELETKQLLLLQAKRSNQTFKETEESRIRKAQAAQDILNNEVSNAIRKIAGCEHATGGFGNEDTYQGDDKPALVMQELPIAGRKHIVCFRCMGEWFTPDPLLKHKDVDAYADQMIEWNQMLKLLKKSMSKPLSGPTFMFEKNGTPIHPEIR